MIGIIDYGLGNVEAFRVAYKRLGKASRRVKTPEDVADVTHIILPGVGAFDSAMERFNASGLWPALKNALENRALPLLGVCVGMQMLADRSDEGDLPGLGLISGNIRLFAQGQHGRMLRCPHMGWNEVDVTSNTPLLSGLEEHRKFYFLHSYYFEPADPDTQLAQTLYGSPFSCAVGKGSVHGVQFHPEKSHEAGLILLNNFSEL